VMDVFVLASWREGMPRSAIEAAAMGRALVLTDIRGCREVARNAREALLVPPRDPGALARAIAHLAADPALRRRLGQAARSRALERFSEAQVAERVVGHYRRLARAPAGPGPVVVRPARVGDAAAMARLHADGMPEAFLPTLGPRFLARLYRALATDPEAVALVAEGVDGVVGFAAGVPSVGGFYRRFARGHGPAAALAAAPRLVRPSVARRLLETVRYPATEVNGNGDGNGRLPDAELLSIAVAPGFRAGGTGRALADGVLTGLAGRGVDDIKVVVGAANQGANRFYAKVGFSHAGHLTVHQGTPSNVWIRSCRSSSPSPSPSS
ncbi:MAG TPA: GNAT family N-acetyltransferase, partial [Actinomycetes bacterium]|nr:GNAT family N-acetyltransferase [Actinomycetes bacterium]